MCKLPEHIQENLKKDKNYYSLYNMDNIDRCKIDPDYLGDVILVNENLIWHCVHKHVGNLSIILSNAAVDTDDILQLGRLGFIKAIQKFDTTRGIKFSSFAVTAITREIKCHLRDNKLLRLTRNAARLVTKIKHLENDLGYLPSVEEIADILGESCDNVKKALTVGKPVKYLDEPYAFTDPLDFILTNELEEGVGVEEYEDRLVDRLYVESLIDSIKDNLDETELNILKSQLDEHTQVKTAQDYNVSQMKVLRTLRKIKRLLKEQQKSPTSVSG